MKIANWKYLISDPEQLDIDNDNIDVSVTLENGRQFNVVITTLKNLESQVKSAGYLLPGCPQIFVEKMSDDLVLRALTDYADGDAHWLKFYHAADIITTQYLDKLQ